jgi:putative multicomponent Na+:H+ antiporter subunit B
MDSYLYWIVALIPLAAGMVVLQEDPYHALVIRGLLGAIAAMTYAVLGAADVALTEALVGTMLAITLYAIAVRSSLVMRVGILETTTESQSDSAFEELMAALRRVLKTRYLRLELIPFATSQSLQRALADREVHAICDLRSPLNQGAVHPEIPYHTTIRVHRLYEILQAELPASVANLSYADVTELQQWSGQSFSDPSPALEEV